MISGVAVALPAIGADLLAGATALALVETIFLRASAAFLLPIGRLGDAVDRAATCASVAFSAALGSPSSKLP